MVPMAGVEPARPYEQPILSRTRLPFRHTGLICPQRLGEGHPAPFATGGNPKSAKNPPLDGSPLRTRRDDRRDRGRRGIRNNEATESHHEGTVHRFMLFIGEARIQADREPRRTIDRHQQFPLP